MIISYNENGPMQRAKVIHRQGNVDVMVSSEPIESAFRTYSNVAKAMRVRAETAWGVRFVETPNSLKAHWPRSQRLPEGWSESVTFIKEQM